MKKILNALWLGFVCSVGVAQDQMILVEYPPEKSVFKTSDSKVVNLIKGLEVFDEEAMKSICEDHVKTLSLGGPFSISNILFYASISHSSESFPGLKITQTINGKELNLTDKIIGTMLPRVLIRKLQILCQDESIVLSCLPDGEFDVFCEKLYSGDIYSECPEGMPLLDFPSFIKHSEARGNKILLATFQMTKALYDNWGISL